MWKENNSFNQKLDIFSYMIEYWHRSAVIHLFFKKGSVSSSAVFHTFTFPVFHCEKPLFGREYDHFLICPHPCFTCCHWRFLMILVTACTNNWNVIYSKFIFFLGGGPNMCIINNLLPAEFVSNSAKYQVESHYYYYLHLVIKEQEIVCKMRPVVTFCISQHWLHLC